ncbi:MAG: thiamine pyrophosphate protein domain protein TPP-binding [Anaeromyxobacteraceae bacterium]|nr:thiamine pyrophosphate protein domain protein TPP-binding [Anaeromyxobacteraceae bacterium]
MAAPGTTTAAAPKQNRIGLTVVDYRGGKTTLCAGCGHNAISERILEACFDLGIPPERVAKFSGIGCSSKSPAYFLSRSHAFNSVHGRMPSVATGALLANKHLLALGVSGDGDTASIGIGQFVHLMRRNLPMVYVVENNGVYGLTKGQFSATADMGSVLKGGAVNDLPPIDTCALAIQLGATFVGISFVPHFEDIAVEYDPGTTVAVRMHDGSQLRLRKLEADYDPGSRSRAVARLMESASEETVLTGVLFADPDAPDFLTRLGTVDAPLATLPQEAVRPSRAVLDEVNGSLR